MVQTRKRRKAEASKSQKNKEPKSRKGISRARSDVEIARDACEDGIAIQRLSWATFPSDVCLVEEEALVEDVAQNQQSSDPNQEDLWFLNGYTGSRDPLSLLLHVCDGETVQSWDQFLDRFQSDQITKIGEGAYSEVYEALMPDGTRVVLKVTPVRADESTNSKSKTFSNILPEVLIYKQLLTLSTGSRYATPCFVGAKRVHLIKGKYPEILASAWKRFTLEGHSYNDSPECFSDRQHFIVFETLNGGIDLENYKFKRLTQALSVFVQVTLSLAVAERVLCFEHRDLHVGNILIRSVPQRALIEFVFRGQKIRVRSHGVSVSIIDFSLSRISEGIAVIRTDLSEESDLFSGEGDYQYEVYRLMKQENGNDWRKFSPRSNVLWLHYLLRYLCEQAQYSTSSKAMERRKTHIRNVFLPAVLGSGSATDVLEHEQLRELFVAHIDVA